MLFNFVRPLGLFESAGKKKHQKRKDGKQILWIVFAFSVWHGGFPPVSYTQTKWVMWVMPSERLFALICISRLC